MNAAVHPAVPPFPALPPPVPVAPALASAPPVPTLPSPPAACPPEPNPPVPADPPPVAPKDVSVPPSGGSENGRADGQAALSNHRAPAARSDGALLTMVPPTSSKCELAQESGLTEI